MYLMGKDVASLLQPSGEDPGVRTDQGTVEAWDPATGDNSVRISGGVLENVATLTSESAALVAGDVVLLMWTGQKWVVLGKLITPGDPGTVPTWNADISALAPLTEIAAVTEGTTMTGIGVQDSTITGSLFRTAATGKRWELDSVNHANQMRGYSGEATETAPGLVEIDSFPDFASALIGAPDLGGEVPIQGPFLYLTTDKTVFSPAAYSYMRSDFLYLQGRADSTFGVLVDCSADGVIFDTTALSPTGGIGFTTNGPVTVNGDEVVRDTLVQAWTNLPLVNSWVSAGGRTAQYMRDATGRVQLRGRISSGTFDATIATLPVGFRPTQTMEWTMRGAGGIVVCAIQVATTGVITAVGNGTTVRDVGANIDVISFPTN